jgi:hypothetical protein
MNLPPGPREAVDGRWLWAFNPQWTAVATRSLRRHIVSVQPAHKPLKIVTGLVGSDAAGGLLAFSTQFALIARASVRAVEVITQVLGVRLASIRSAVEIVDGLSEELALGPLVDFKQIRFPGLEELIAGAEP